ncbi:MAG TPA: energy-coupling factor transporter transmembrane protein EcfT [Clostridiales bacterium]|nr:energy-coupling factor transporter transmembrane protein EcfT [Clostridiales bacterium]
MKNKKIEIDPRIQLIILILMGCLVLFANVNQLMALNGFSLLFLILNGKYRKAFNSIVFLVLIYGMHHVIQQSDQQFIKLLGFFTFLALRFMPILLIASVLQDVPSGRLIASLQKIKIPKNILITFSVTLRFFPIMQYESEAIQMSSKLRGLSFKQPKNWLHPLNSFEYTIVPLMMRTLKISDELAASASTKGIDYPAMRTSIYVIQVKWFDVSMVVLFVVWSICVFLFIR